MATSETLSNRWPIIIHSFTVYCSDANHNELQGCINGDVIWAWALEEWHRNASVISIVQSNGWAQGLTLRCLSTQHR
jgi:hypothetical protein